MTGEAMGMDLLATATGGEARAGALGGEEIKEEIGDTGIVGLVRGAGKGWILDGDKDEA